MGIFILMKFSGKQKLTSLINKGMTGNRYIVNEREGNQKRLFICSCCGKEFDFSNSTDYIGAVEQWEQLGGKCYACGNGLCHCADNQT